MLRINNEYFPFKMVLYFTRHAQQVSHTLDPPIILNKVNFEYPIKFDYAITSPYLRCRQTAEVIYDGDIYVDVRLSEYHTHKKKLNGQFDLDSLIYGDLPSPKESWEDFTQRIDQFIDDFIDVKDDILVVTHGMTIKYLYEKYNIPFEYERARYVPFATIILTLTGSDILLHLAYLIKMSIFIYIREELQLIPLHVKHCLDLPNLTQFAQDGLLR